MRGNPGLYVRQSRFISGTLQRRCRIRQSNQEKDQPTPTFALGLPVNLNAPHRRRPDHWHLNARAGVRLHPGTMSQTIISINAGSSSVKVTLFKTVEDDAKIRELATANVAGVGSPPAKLTYSRADHKSITDLPKDATSHDDAFKCLLQAFVDDKGLTDVLKKEDIAYTCHRVVHGGDYKEYVVITDETYHHIENLEDLAPL